MVNAILIQLYLVPPIIQKSPSIINKQEHQNVSFPCITLAGNPKPLTFKWFYKGYDGQPKIKVRSDVKAYDRDYLNISNVGYNSIGDYECIVSNGYGNFDSFKFS